MSKRPILIFVLFFAAFAIALPLWAINKEGASSASPQEVAPGDENAKELFNQGCGACHTFAAAGTDGVVGPDLDELFAGQDPAAIAPRVESAIANGVQGAMPAGILQGDDAMEVSDYVARNAGR